MLENPPPKAKLLYVDDEIDNLIAFKAMFRREYDIVTASSGAEAIRLLAEQTFPMVISDQRMPEMTGVELFSKIKDKYPEVIRIVLTGYTDFDGIVDAINKGKIYYFIAKPWNADEVKVIIANALETYNLRVNNKALTEENIIAQYNVLKNQINPHFLFNSMNILSAIIPTDPDKAVEFTNEFSKLYRSVLELREQLIVSLEEELVFVKSYIHLQKVRFEDALFVEFGEFTKLGLAKAMPPFCLQILVENAIKHNVVSVDKPLHIKIVCDENRVFVKNNLQLRPSVKDSTGTGLNNIKSRYQLIGGEQATFTTDENFYTASLPLI